MIAEINKKKIAGEELNALFNKILEEAETCAVTYNDDKANLFNQGMAQAYTEVLDNIQHWAEDNDIELGIDLEKWTVDNLG